MGKWSLIVWILCGFSVFVTDCLAIRLYFLPHIFTALFLLPFLSAWCVSPSQSPLLSYPQSHTTGYLNQNNLE